MELRHLRYFLAVAEERHFGRAAQRLAITQPPLSLAIQQLEAELGARLLDRDPRGVRPTAAGLAFAEHARAILARSDEARLAAQEIHAGAAGRLRIGFVGALLYAGLTPAMQRFRQQHPRVALALTELNSQEQLDALVRDELDLGFVHTERVPDGLHSRRLRRDAFVCCVPADHRLAAQPAVALAELRDEPLALFSRQASPDYHARILAMCAAAGFHPRVRHEARHWLSVVALVGQGLAVAVLPQMLARAGLPGAVFRPLRDATAPSELHAVWRSGGTATLRDAFLGVAAEAIAGAGVGVDEAGLA